ncbi:heparinase II/III family protein [Zavarzinia sp. CC-PAN008]|uniref:heparinase II/III family protein n=1 Tax=Zavarzinia sp. CC-PAN008 TaxID=3243332 RepID=UPI003F748A83
MAATAGANLGRGAVPAVPELALPAGPRLAAGQIRRLMLEAFLASPLYRLMPASRVPADLLHRPGDLWPGDPAVGNALFQGRYGFSGEEFVSPNRPPWALPGSQRWRASVHGFAWLRHFEACSGDAARRQVRGLIATWLEPSVRLEATAWAPEVIGRRLMSWTTHAALILDGAPDEFRRAVLQSLGRQTAQLDWIIASTPEGQRRITALTGLLHGALCLGLPDAMIRRAMGRLEQELKRQVMADGAHVSRSPAQLLSVLANLVQLRALLLISAPEVPGFLQNAIDRMAPMLRCFRLGDGGLGQFNGSGPELGGTVDLVLARADAKGRPLGYAPQAGFHRLTARRTILLMDVGGPPPAGFRDGAHAAPLAFEMSVGKERLIVNCGPSPKAGLDRGAQEWQRVSRATAAHSTLTLGDRNAVPLPAGRRLGDRLPGARLLKSGLGRAPASVACSRNEADGAIWIEAAHDGYVEPFGLVHRRRLYLDASGEDLRGEDEVVPRSGASGRSLPYALRFHLHPNVQASLLGDGSVLMRLASGEGWRLSTSALASGGTVALDESIYLGEPGVIRRSEQVVVTGVLDEGRLSIKWALRKVDGRT